MDNNHLRYGRRAFRQGDVPTAAPAPKRPFGNIDHPVDTSVTGQSAAEKALESSARKYGKAILGEQQRHQERRSGMQKFRAQMERVSQRREEQLTGWQNYRWIDQWGDDTANRGITLAATNSWVYAPRYGYA